VSSTEDLRTAATAYADQHETAVRYVERAWPYNGHLNNDEPVSRAVRAGLGGWGGADHLHDDEPMRNGVGYLLVPAAAGRAELDPEIGVESLIRSTVPTPPTACDRCDAVPSAGAGRFGWLVMRAAPHLIALSICDSCAVTLNSGYPSIHWIF